MLGGSGYPAKFQSCARHTCCLLVLGQRGGNAMRTPGTDRINLSPRAKARESLPVSVVTTARRPLAPYGTQRQSRQAVHQTDQRGKDGS
ncbi:hypothetical protein L226DRAFT_247915 [Lentinus tigrinus ALCF2SS1-7]|uniref:uncharacterized protein n=1 Tax=Lentinus tigrinus ALCF2SS1-7 TaxID=1328758 RepID=UPI001165F5D6|nr:hypothetical protein L226DRAFT_247915 [Lentinus tigrinus ALCF2SS1-7]